MTCCDPRPCSCSCSCRCRCKRPECPPEDGPVCQLDCLERPRFKPGQRLQADDLEALVSYAEARFGLVRYRAGWGIVCGLELTADPDHPTRIHVRPGYAIDCCGNVLVLCEPVCLDLRRFCRGPSDCLEADEETTCTLAGVRFPSTALRRVDILLARDAEAATRRRQLAVPHAQPASDPPDPATAFNAAWANADTRTGWDDGPQLFPWLDDFTGIDAENWQRLDRRITLLDRRCHACDAGDVLRLGRVWLTTGAGSANEVECCRIAFIDGQERVRRRRRRRLRQDWPPAPPGQINLPAAALWREPGDAALRLVQAGLTTPPQSQDQTALRAHSGIPAFVSPNSNGKLYTVTLDCFGIGERVVGWAA
jgi:hypothetical protein